ncbi:MAG: hypothetical protein QOE86_1897 [Solirubrobacteraceae bacterium]|jgi:hypothetical protein|nr:hypothetical protein [Solirubrobacteraceae bacterium]
MDLRVIGTALALGLAAAASAVWVNWLAVAYFTTWAVWLPAVDEAVGLRAFFKSDPNPRATARARLWHWVSCIAGGLACVAAGLWLAFRFPETAPVVLLPATLLFLAAYTVWRIEKIKAHSTV